MSMNRIPIYIIGPLYISLWVKKNWEIMKLSAQNWQRWKSNKSQQWETSAIKKQVKYHSGTAIQREVKTSWLCLKKHPGTNSESECAPLDVQGTNVISKSKGMTQAVRKKN